MTLTRTMGWALFCPHNVMVGAATARHGIAEAVEALEPEPGDKLRRLPVDQIRVSLDPCADCMARQRRGRHLRRTA